MATASSQAFEKEFPETIAFYNWSEEYDFLSRCAQSATSGKFRLWGLDQELMGASRLLLTQILQQHLSPAASAEGRHLLEENDAAHVRATQSGNPFDLFMMTASDVELAHFRETLVHEGNPALPRMLDGLLGSKASRRVLPASAGHRNLETSTSRKIRILTFFI
jgi:hypothetical protein